MTRPSKGSEELDEIRHASICPAHNGKGKCDCMTTINTAALTQLLSNKEREAETRGRIAELEYWQWKTDGHIEMSGKDVAARLKELTGVNHGN